MKIKLLIMPLAIFMAFYHFLYIYYPFLDYSRLCITHVIFAITIVYLSRINKVHKSSNKMWLMILLVATLISLIYIYTQADRLELEFGMGLSSFDFYAGLLVLCFIIIVVYLVWGLVFPLIASIAILYFFFGHHLPGVMGFIALGKEDVMDYLVTGISSGIFGYLIPISTGLIFYFMVFGGVLGATGVLPLFLEFGKWLGNLFRGGASLTALVGSSLVGSVTGVTIANIAFTGSYTIPAMKKQGFNPPSAAAIESVASSGGQLMPPIMGNAVFLMAVLLGIPYWNIVVRALVPAFIYYFITCIGIMLLINRYDVRPKHEPVDRNLIICRTPLFLLPIFILMVLLYRGISPGKAISSSFFALTAIAIIYQILRRLRVKYFVSSGPQISLKDYFEGVQDGVIRGCEVAIAIVVISLIAQTAISTGMGSKLGYFLMSLSFGYQSLALVMIMMACIILGMGMPTLPVYALLSMVMVPTLNRELGIDPFSAHFFVFYFAVFAGMTPPIATAALVSCKIALCSFWKAALHGFRLSLPLFFVPFAWIREPQILNVLDMRFSGIMMLFVILVSAFTIGMATYGCFLFRLNYFEYIVCIISLCFWIAYMVFINDNWIILIAIFMTLTVVVSQFFRRAKTKKESTY